VSTPPAETAVCDRCGREYEPVSGDLAGLCPECRASIIRKAGLWGRLSAFAITALIALAILLLIRPERFLFLWMALLVGIYYVAFKIARRTGFDLIREREIEQHKSE